MLAKKYLLGKREISRVYKKGIFVRGNNLSIKYCQSLGKHNRFAFVVSKKVSNKATVRNRIKRWLSEAVFEKKNKLKIPYDIILIAGPKIIDNLNNYKNSFEDIIIRTRLL